MFQNLFMSILRMIRLFRLGLLGFLFLYWVTMVGYTIMYWIMGGRGEIVRWCKHITSEGLLNPPLWSWTQFLLSQTTILAVTMTIYLWERRSSRDTLARSQKVERLK